MKSTEVFCLTCNKAYEIMEFFKNEDIELEELDDLPIRIIGFKENGTYTCSLCEFDLEFEDYFIDSESDYERFIEISVEKIGECLSTKVESCNKCPDGEILESYHLTYNKEEGTNEYTGTLFWDFIRENGIENTKLMDQVLRYIECSSCGYGAEYDKDEMRIFNFDDKVISSEEINDFFGDDYGLNYEELNNVATRYGIDLKIAEIEDFIDKITENPMLAYQHKTGVKLYNLLKQIFDKDDIFNLEIGTMIFRGRNRKKDEIKLTSEQLWSPPIGNAGHGRYNLIGLPVLYCSDSTKGIPYELNPINNDYIDVGTFYINSPLKLLDISEIFNEEFGEFIGSVNYESKHFKKGYLFTNFIKDCCATIGFNGIRYKGVGKENYYNYALFNFDKGNELKVSENVNTLNCNISYTIQEKI
ncbi:RES domain-containing protein [Jeotgalibacillus haloalkalitolerans]|uniref:RES domain-containing protein n=1 Tax=Jeotgalibacillus haloalkalitolerans TaxID=3104292 RepID=A0ABU5KQN1_9BACL|nr:RES domain-containing protein [Jeotgalibacillus sp. HH7-29]MDZ5713558.1 RES domain-containing protein [Jeotgalibacillus sp. HH7-29]